jgi:hypothetical protein
VLFNIKIEAGDNNAGYRFTRPNGETEHATDFRDLEGKLRAYGVNADEFERLRQELSTAGDASFLWPTGKFEQVT